MLGYKLIMDAKEIKSLLKQAKEAIKNKEYKTALKHCKAVLKNDKCNYNAWVFAGIAAQETEQLEQAETAFLKAIDIAPDQVLAWQGICNFYEKQNDDDKLVEVYIKLLKLPDNEHIKKFEVMDKLIAFVKKKGDKDKVIEVLELQLTLVKDDAEKENVVWKSIFQELSGESNLNTEQENLLNTAFQKISNHPTFTADDCATVVKSYITSLYKRSEINKAVELTWTLYKKIPSKECLELLLKASFDSYIKTGSVLQEYDKLVQDSKEISLNNQWISKVAQSLSYLLEKNYMKTIQELREGILLKDNSIEAWYLLTKVQLILHLYQDAEKCAKTGLRFALKAGTSPDIIGHFHLFLGKALSKRKMWDDALKAFEKCFQYEGRTPEILEAFCYTLLEMNQLDKAENIILELNSETGTNSKVLLLEGYLDLLKKSYNEALNKLRNSVSIEESAFALYLIAVVLWETKLEEKAFKIFLKAAELDPYFAKNFLYLGHYYQSHLNDIKKARMCYQKAFDLDTADQEAGMFLSNILKDLGEDEENLVVLKTVTQQTPSARCKWAWTQLGLYQLEKNETSEAIFSLQNAVRLDPSNSHGWECLGDAYFKRGSYESALKAFEKASELNPKAMYPLYQISTIQKIRGLYVESIKKYKDLLMLEPTYVPALIGLAETLILLGKKYYYDSLFGCSRDAFQESLDVLSSIVLKSLNLSCLWKLAGDACTFLFHLGDEWFPVNLKLEFLQNSDGNSMFCQKKEILAFGQRFYGRALCYKPNLSALWHDLGINYYFQSILYDPPDSTDFAKKAFLCLQKAISLCPTYHAHWTVLGIISVSREIQDYALAQHCFIKSIEMERNNAEAWTNLGLLYLEKQDIKLAHNAFKVAQSLDPMYPLCWIGQAVIANTVKHSDTLDLFRHTTTLGSHTEALLGYGRSVCETLLDKKNQETELYKYNIEEMDAVVVASDCITKYVSNNKNCPEAFNILGLLLERQKMYNSAVKMFKRALDLFEESGRLQEVEKVRANYARLLVITGYPDEAISEYLELKKTDTPLLCSFAFALYKKGDFKTAYDILEGALKTSSTASEKSHILVAKAMIAMQIYDSEAPDSLKLLYESSQMKPPSVQGLLALYAFGIKKNYGELAIAAFKELIPFQYHKKYGPSVALLSAIHTYIQNGVKPARNKLVKAIHIQPNLSALWMQTASCLLQWNSAYASTAATCSEAAIFHGGSKELASQIFALCRLSSGYKRVALYAAQKAVHIRPDNLSNWVTLAAACHVANKDRKCVGWIFGFVKQLAKKQGIKPDILAWLVAMEIFHYIHSKNISAANSLSKTILASIDSVPQKFQPVFKILDAIISMFLENGKLDNLVFALKQHSDYFLMWHIWIQILLHLEKINETEKALSLFTVAAEKHFPNWNVFPLLQLATLSYHVLNIGQDPEKWLSMGKQVVEEAVKLSPENQAARFMQGLFALKSGNMNLALRSFKKVVYSVSIKEFKWMEKMSVKLLVSLFLKKKDKEALQQLAHCYPDIVKTENLFIEFPEEMSKDK